MPARPNRPARLVRTLDAEWQVSRDLGGQSKFHDQLLFCLGHEQELMVGSSISDQPTGASLKRTDEHDTVFIRGKVEVFDTTASIGLIPTTRPPFPRVGSTLRWRTRSRNSRSLFRNGKTWLRLCETWFNARAGSGDGNWNSRQSYSITVLPKVAEGLGRE